MDGAFIVSDDGVFLAAGRYLDANASNVEVPLGLGSRHIAAASISFATNAIAIGVSESSIVRVFQHGALVAEIIPELWLFSAMRCFFLYDAVGKKGANLPSLLHSSR